jgi:hypothetical protein
MLSKIIPIDLALSWKSVIAALKILSKTRSSFSQKAKFFEFLQ